MCGCSNQNLGVICLRYPKVSFKYFPKLEVSGLDKIKGGVIRPTCRRCDISKLPELLLSQNIQAGHWSNSVDLTLLATPDIFPGDPQGQEYFRD